MIKKFMLTLLCAALSMGLAYAQFRDPTRPPDGDGVGFQTSGVAGFVLNSILLSPQRKLALINGSIVRQGDQVNGATVVKIVKNKVYLDGDDGKFTLTLISQDVKTQSQSIRSKIKKRSGIN